MTSSSIILRIAGVNHFDPAGRQRLVEWLLSCSKKFGKPAFVATEWDKGIFVKVKSQREEFQRLIGNQWPTVSSRLSRVLTLSLAYEGDAHTQVFPDVEVLWLDQGRKAPEGDIRKYAVDRFGMYKRWLGDAVAENEDSAILEKMSKKAAEEAGDPPANGNERDAKFAELILRKAAYGGDWAIIIVGKFHALNCARSMRELLEARKQICEVEFL